MLWGHAALRPPSCTSSHAHPRMHTIASRRSRRPLVTLSSILSVPYHLHVDPGLFQPFKVLVRGEEPMVMSRGRLSDLGRSSSSLLCLSVSGPLLLMYILLSPTDRRLLWFGRCDDDPSLPWTPGRLSWQVQIILPHNVDCVLYNLIKST